MYSAVPVEIAAQINVAMASASTRVDEKTRRAAQARAEGQAGKREEGYTEELADIIDDLGKEMAKSIGELNLPTAGLRFQTHRAVVKEETVHGIDLGIRLVISTPSAQLTKVVLVQCKKMTGLGLNGTFDALRKDGPAQAQKMLAISPASFFVLFNGGSREELFQLLYPQGLWVTEMWDRLFQPAITVLPATRVLAASQGSAPLSAKADGWLRGSIPIATFLTNYMLSCFVGDVRPEVVRIATPPGQRTARTGRERFGIQPRHYYSLEIDVEDERTF